MTEQMKNMIIGLFVIGACVLIVASILFIEPSTGDGKQKLIVRFSNITGLNVGTRVLFAGRPVGEVSQIETIPHAREQPIDHSGNVYYYQLILHIDSKLRVFNTDEITVQTSGLLGEKSIAIIPKTAPKGIHPKLLTSRTPVYAESSDPLQAAFAQLTDLGKRLDSAIDEIMMWFEENSETLSFAVASFGNAMNEISIMMKDINEQGIIDDVKKTTSHLASAMEYIDQGLVQLKKDHFFENVGEISVSFNEASKDVASITKDISTGRGTIGKLITGDDMYLQVSALMSKANTLMNDINHYGLMFNYNKEWQRTRLKQMTLMNALDTPNEFRSYFESEVDKINTAMGRISVLIDRADQTVEKQQIFKNAAFRDDFADLLRQVQELSNQLKRYNEELIEFARQRAS